MLTPAEMTAFANLVSSADGQELRAAAVQIVRETPSPSLDKFGLLPGQRKDMVIDLEDGMQATGEVYRQINSEEGTQ